jgi:hypothetical protein
VGNPPLPPPSTSCPRWSPGNHSCTEIGAHCHRRRFHPNPSPRGESSSSSASTPQTTPPPFPSANCPVLSPEFAKIRLKSVEPRAASPVSGEFHRCTSPHLPELSPSPSPSPCPTGPTWTVGSVATGLARLGHCLAGGFHAAAAALGKVAAPGACSRHEPAN